MKTVRRPPYPKWNPGYFPCSSLTPLPLSSRRPSVSFGGFGLSQAPTASAETPPRDFFGTVLSAEDGVLVVSTEHAIFEVMVTSTTAIRLPLKRDASLLDLIEGDEVAISLVEEGSPVADRIVVISSKTRYRHIPGRISAASEAEVTIVGRGENAEPQTFNLTSETRVVRHGRTTALTEGMTVVVVAVRDSDTGELSPDAREIFVIPGRRTRSAEEPTDQQPSEDEASSDATITGVFERIDKDGDWIVGGTKVSIRSSTRHERGFNIGQVIRIDAELAASGKLVAREVLSRARSEVVESKTRLVGVYKGKDQQGRWIVSGSRVAVTVRSDTDGEPRVGQRINVTARRLILS